MVSGLESVSDSKRQMNVWVKYLIFAWLVFDSLISMVVVNDKRLIMQAGRIVRLLVALGVLLL